MSFLRKIPTVSNMGTRISIFASLVITLFFVFNTYSQSTKLGNRIYGDRSSPQTNRNIVKQNNFVPQKPTVTEKKATVISRSRTDRRIPSGRATRSTKERKVPQTKKPIQVTFIGKEPFVEVWINDKNVGATDMESRFIKSLVPGEYRLMARANKTIYLPTRKITVSPENNSFNLFLEPRNIPRPELTDSARVPTQIETPKNELQLAIEISEKAKNILQRYRNSETTDSVTVEDWEFVYQTARLGQFQDFTAVQTEAQRWFASGQIEISKKEYLNALAAFKKAEELMPTSGLPYYAMGDAYLANKQYADAVLMYQTALRKTPKMGMAYKKLGDAQRMLNKDKEAISAYKYAIANDYKTAETKYWLGTLMLETKQIEQALSLLEEVAKEMAKPEVYITIGTGYEKIKRNVSAMENYEKAIQLDPNSAIAHFKLGNVLLNQRENGKAKEVLEKAMRLDPDGKQVNRSEAQKKLREASQKQNR